MANYLVSGKVSSRENISSGKNFKNKKSRTYQVPTLAFLFSSIFSDTGFALGPAIYLVGFIVLNVIPYGYVVISVFYAPFTYTFQTVMGFIYPVIWSIPFIFIQRTKTAV